LPAQQEVVKFNGKGYYMLLGIELIAGLSFGIEYIEDSDFHYILLDIGIIRLQWCKEKPLP
jgi:hypothetical protein